MSNVIKAAFVGAVIAGGLAMPALAGGLAEPVVEAPIAPVAPVVVGTDWTGFYVGGDLGYGDVSTTGEDGDGLMYGLRGGYDYDFGNWVLGGRLDYDWSDINLANNAGSVDSVWRLGARAGADLGRTLIYGIGGYTEADATVGGTSYSDDGWFLGIGADYLITDRWTVGAEILTHQYDNFGGTGTDVDATTASVTAGFRF
ncbi:outer membrane protein [Defluviimonas salinarum]|uniref:Porin family protein n=1 Tax=Defluviimonas salinarum TaxID=2992147 RepID=A0ABT3J0I5_9RHOB|nr:porin family protein [Defluviimonas salinarum]MCW3781188.1 porin family protein [Defluviimonas salinarum]